MWPRSKKAQSLARLPTNFGGKIETHVALDQTHNFSRQSREREKKKIRWVEVEDIECPGDISLLRE